MTGRLFVRCVTRRAAYHHAVGGAAVPGRALRVGVKHDVAGRGRAASAAPRSQLAQRARERAVACPGSEGVGAEPAPRPRWRCPAVVLAGVTRRLWTGASAGFLTTNSLRMVHQQGRPVALCISSSPSHAQHHNHCPCRVPVAAAARPKVLWAPEAHKITGKQEECQRSAA